MIPTPPIVFLPLVPQTAVMSLSGVRASSSRVLRGIARPTALSITSTRAASSMAADSQQQVRLGIN